MADKNPTDSSTTERSERNGNQRTTRRRLLGGLVAGASLLAGCSSLAGNDSTDTPTSTTTARQTTETGTQTATLAEIETAIPTATTTADSTPTSLPTETALPTQTATATTTPFSTRTPVATATPAVTTTPVGTSTSTSTGSGASISPADLTTYTNTHLGYSIKYPTGWEVLTSSGSTIISIRPPSGRAHIEIFTYTEIPFSPSTLDAFTTYFVEAYRPAFEKFTIERRQAVTLSNGNRGRVLYVSTRSSEGTDMRLTWLFTIVNGTGYAVQMSFPDKAYNQTLKRTINAIVESFTVKTS